MAGKAVSESIDFSQSSGSYMDVAIATITHTGGKLDFTFVSTNGGTLVPVSVSLKVTAGSGETADKTDLQTALTAAAAYQQADYTADSWNTFVAAKAAAQAEEKPAEGGEQA